MLTRYGILISLVVLALVPGTAVADDPSPLYVAPAAEYADSAAMEVIARLVIALAIEDDDARLQAVLPLFHPDRKTKDGTDLIWTVKNYSYKVAVQDAGMYKVPVEFARVTKRKEGDIGFQETADRGFYQTYYVKRTEKVGGPPPPVTVFYPSDGSPPKIYQISL